MSVLRNSSNTVMDSAFIQVGDALYSLPPIRYLLIFIKICIDFLMDRMVLAFMSFFLGMAAILAAELLIFRRYLSKAPILPPPKFEHTRAHLPKVLKSRLEENNLQQKEDCIWLNFLLQFLFSELKDSLHLRRYLTKKIQMEFEDVLKSRSGFLVDELFLRDFRLGDKFPVIMGMSLDKSEVSQDEIQTIDLRFHVIYDGGFQIAIDAALPFSRVACVSVTVAKLDGVLRLQFTQIPFTHWNISFYEEPELEVDVTAQLDGRPVPRLKNIIANQIRRIIRKKHTLPMYKMRLKPFFQRGLDQGQAKGHVHISGSEIACGILEVTVIEAGRLPFVVKGAQVYCTLSVDELPWKDKMMIERKRKKVVTVELTKPYYDQTLGMTLRDELMPDRLIPVVMIGEVNVGSPAYQANIQQGDILLAIGGVTITSAKQAMKNIKATKDRIRMQIERGQTEMTAVSDTVFPRKVNSWHDRQTADSDRLSSIGSTTIISKAAKPKKFKYTTVTKRTTLIDAAVNPQWNQKFVFSVDSNVHYLNICLWSKGGDRSSKPDIISCTTQDILLGYITLDLNEIYLHCLITLNGTIQDKVQLKHGHYKTQDELIKIWSMHKGWDMNQMYGDIFLGFHYRPTSLSTQQRQVLSGSKRDSIWLKNQLFESYSLDKVDESKSLPTRLREDLRRDLNEGHHQFDSTSFMTATFCDYCGKKIWMKEAFKCQTCCMVCHKKCLVKCLINTICTEGGPRRRDCINELWEPLTSTGKTKRPVVTDDLISSLGFQEEDFMSQSGVFTTDLNTNTSESTQSLTNLYDGNYADSEEKGLLSTMRKQENTQEVNPMARFRGLKEQTDRMKDNVLKHLRRNKVPAAFNDRAILSAKDLGARLFLDMDPTLRKDKLEELVKKLDQELKAEMENKESIEQELTVLEIAEQKNPSSKRKSEIRSLSNKILKSVEKQDAMRLLMLQYCSGLQNCINSLEAEVNLMRSRSEFIDGNQICQKDDEPPKTSRSTAVGGFVRRASSSVKEKMSFIKKDFGKKGAKSGEDEKPLKSNNSGLNVIKEWEDISSQDSMEEANLQQRSRSQSQEHVHNITNEVKEMKEVTRMTEMPAQMSGVPVVVSHPAVEICVDEVDVPAADTEAPVDHNEPSILSQEGAGIPRSSSDSRLEISKVLSLGPEDILRYRGTSLPRLLASDESDSDSDYFVIDSSDEHAVTDSSDSSNEEDDIGFKDGKNKHNDDDSDDGSGQHRGSIQQLQTFQV